MALPLLAPTVRRRMDPKDKLDIYVVLSQGDGVADILQPGELVTRFSIGLTPTAIAAGVLISDGEASPRYADRVFFIQLRVDPSMRISEIFNDGGVVAGIEIEFATNIEDREKQYTVGLKVVNK